MNEKAQIKALNRSLQRSGDKITLLKRIIKEQEEEIEVLKGEMKGNEPMYVEENDSYFLLTRQFKEFMEDMKSFSKWFKYKLSTLKR